MISWPFGRPRPFPGLPQLCSTSPLRVSSWQSTPILSLGSDPRSLSLSTQPPLAALSMQTASQLGSAARHWSFCQILSALSSTHLLLCFPLRFWSSFLSPQVQGFLSVWKLFFLFEIRDPSHFLCIFIFLLPFPIDLCGMSQRLKHLPTMWETWVRSLGQKDLLEKEMATHSSILA